MLKVYYQSYNKESGLLLLEKYKGFLPVQMQARSEKYLSQEAKINFIIGRLLLKKGLENLGMGEAFEKIKTSENGKPYVEGIHFNISHTSGMVICAFSNEEIGIDIEKKRQLPLADFEPYFTISEWLEIKSAEDSSEVLLKFWVKKESIIKNLGISLKVLNQIDLKVDSEMIFFQGRMLYLKELNLDQDYYCTICTCDLVSEIAFTASGEIKKGKE